MEVKNQMDFSAIMNFRKSLTRFKMPYTITVTNYTTKIESDLGTHHFLRDSKSNVFFAAAAKVKSDCLKKPVPIIDHNGLNYFFHRFNEITPEMLSNFSCVDINSAYPTALLNAGFISQETFDYLKKIPKLDRLGAIGMLASEKSVFKVDATGKAYNYEKITSPNAGYFYYAVQKINEIVMQVQNSFMHQFLFSWVDGIYLSDNGDFSGSKVLAEYLAEIGYKSKIEILSDPEIRKLKTATMYFYTSPTGKRKFLTFPNNKAGIKRQLIKAIFDNSPLLKKGI